MLPEACGTLPTGLLGVLVGRRRRVGGSLVVRRVLVDCQRVRTTNLKNTYCHGGRRRNGRGPNRFSLSALVPAISSELHTGRGFCFRLSECSIKRWKRLLISERSHRHVGPNEHRCRAHSRRMRFAEKSLRNATAQVRSVIDARRDEEG